MKRKKIYILIFSAILFLVLMISLIKLNGRNTDGFRFPVDASGASQYELKEEISVDKLNFRIEGLTNVKGKRKIKRCSDN